MRKIIPIVILVFLTQLTLVLAKPKNFVDFFTGWVSDIKVSAEDFLGAIGVLIIIILSVAIAIGLLKMLADKSLGKRVIITVIVVAAFVAVVFYALDYTANNLPDSGAAEKFIKAWCKYTINYITKNLPIGGH